jgi:thioesterase domain-containing protein
MSRPQELFTSDHAEANATRLSGLYPETIGEMSEKPLLFVLPPLIDNDPLFDRVWDPLRATFDIDRLSYLDWTELAKEGADLLTLKAHVRHQIESKSPSGPLWILGYSLGGWLAYLCARDLEEAGRTVVSVAILDAAATKQPDAATLAYKLRCRLQRLFSLNVRGTIASIIAKCLIKEPSLRILHKLARFRHIPLPLSFDMYIHPKLTMQMELRLFHAWWATASPPAMPLNASTFIYRAESFNSLAREDLGWGEYCSNLKVIRVAGDHGSMLHKKNNAALLASIAEVMSSDHPLATSGYSASGISSRTETHP